MSEGGRTSAVGDGEGATMFRLVPVIGQILRVVARPIVLIRDGQSDIDGTYPDHVRGTGEQAAVTGSLFVTMSGNC